MTGIMEKREKIARLEHQQWVSWSRSLAKDLEAIKDLLVRRDDHPGLCVEAINMIDRRLRRWEASWVPYEALPEEIKDLDRVWADKALKVWGENKDG